ncbi:MAG: hypothetical protein ACM3ON_03795 [Chloroflexota bacterium]
MKRFAVAVMLLLLPSLVYAGAAKPSWKKDYKPKNTSEQELLKACAYGNIKACYSYHSKYIVGESGEKAK